ncbi:K02A2.6-like [Cordylochernes scorpioides]|uniref:K02A2.6-like n=1 Tax=Cordylochernes scorpioides TaxID=51811 RepID=A0ABY6LEY0_9ARAC|nr:K02A2.6-like [Cordylochernes scorpioides]
MTPRIQRLRLRMMRYSYSIHHTPGKDIVVADALSRSPIKISHEKDLGNEICSFVQQITSCPPFKDENMKEIWQYQNEERVCREIEDYCEKGWPTKNELSAEAKAFWCLRYEISVIDGLLMRNSKIYIVALGCGLADSSVLSLSSDVSCIFPEHVSTILQG